MFPTCTYINKFWVGKFEQNRIISYLKMQYEQGSYLFTDSGEIILLVYRID